MKRFCLVSVLLLCVFAVSASPSLSGSSYSLDSQALKDIIVEIAASIEPSVAELDENVLDAFIDLALLELFGTSTPAYTFTFQDDSLLMTVEDEEPIVTDYSVDDSGILYMEGAQVGTFSEDYSTLTISDESGLSIVLNRIN